VLDSGIENSACAATTPANPTLAHAPSEATERLLHRAPWIVSANSNGESHLLGDPEVKRVLAIDDDLTTLTMISLACRAMQANVRLETASTVERANWLCRQKRYDLILLDYQLGTMTGIEWIDGIRQVLRPSTGVVSSAASFNPPTCVSTTVVACFRSSRSVRSPSG